MVSGTKKMENDGSRTVSSWKCDDRFEAAYALRILVLANVVEVDASPAWTKARRSYSESIFISSRLYTALY